jgi:hypothetical protein
MRKIALMLLVVGVLAAATVPALAARGGKGKPSPVEAVAATITLDQTDPHYGDVVSFTASHEPIRQAVSIWLHCNQSGTAVYQHVGLASDSVPLGGAGVSSGWASGAASCVAELYYYVTKGQTQTELVMLASTSFDVAA